MKRKCSQELVGAQTLKKDLGGEPETVIDTAAPLQSEDMVPVSPGEQQFSPPHELNTLADKQKSVDSKSSSDSSEYSCPLLKVLGQYGLLDVIASNILPQDLFALAATSKSAYKAIFCTKVSRKNLLGKMRCAGRGIAIRNSHHKKSIWFSEYHCTEDVKCGTQNPSLNIESRPCQSCGIVTCNECRIHCVYGSILQHADDEDDLPGLSGFALLSSHEMGISTPTHMGLASPSIVPKTPYHDQGYLDLPLECPSYAQCQSVDSIIDFDLGLGPLQLSNTSTEPHPTPIIQAFWEVTERRKIRVCEGCSYQLASTCDCTLRKAFLDRWLCLPCYQAEQETAAKFNSLMNNHCGLCAINHGQSRSRFMCSWCYGIVRP